MSVKLSCVDCDWWGSYPPAETPYFCPECGGQLESGVEFTDIEPDEKKSNKI